VPLQVVLLIDESASAARRIPSTHAAAMDFVAQQPGAEFLVLKFAAATHRVTDWTANPEEIRRGLAIPISGDATRLRDAIHVALHHLRHRSGRRLLIVFSDGRDTTLSRLDTASIAKSARNDNVQVLTLGIGSTDLDEGPLRTLATNTRGAYRRIESRQALVDWFGRLGTSAVSPVYRLTFARPIKGAATIRIGEGPTRIELQLILPGQTAANPVNSNLARTSTQHTMARLCTFAQAKVLRSTRS
jgi:hypothetical protein